MAFFFLFFSAFSAELRLQEVARLIHVQPKAPRPPRHYLEGVEAGDDSAVLHMAAPGGVGELALGVRPRAGAPLELAAHFQGQPLSVTSHGHADGHRRGGGRLAGTAGEKEEKKKKLSERSKGVTEADVRQKKKVLWKKQERKWEREPFFFSPLSPDGEWAAALSVVLGKIGS